MDESKRRGVVLVAVLVPSSRVVAARRRMRALLLPNQSHLHFKEPDRRRKQIIETVLELEVGMRVYDASGVRDPREARARSLQLMVRDLAPFRPLLIIERDESLVRADQRTLSEELHRQELTDVVGHRHVPKRDDPGLWLADAVAWCWTHPEWRSRLEGVSTVDVAQTG